MGGAQGLQEPAKRAFPRWLGYRRVSVRFLHGVFSSCQPHTHFRPSAHLPTEIIIVISLMKLKDLTERNRYIVKFVLRTTTGEKLCKKRKLKYQVTWEIE